MKSITINKYKKTKKNKDQKYTKAIDQSEEKKLFKIYDYIWKTDDF